MCVSRHVHADLSVQSQQDTQNAPAPATKHSGRTSSARSVRVSHSPPPICASRPLTFISHSSRCSSSRSSRARGAPLQPGVHPRQPPGSPPSRHQPRLSLDRGHLGRFSCDTVGAFAASGPSDTFEVHQVSQQGLEVFVRPQEGQEVKGSSGGAVYIHEGERGVDMIVGV